MPSTKITVRNDGPLRVEGEFEIVDMQGQSLRSRRAQRAIALCRCGHSANKPFCDGAHKTAGFQDQQQARELPPPKAADQSSLPHHSDEARNLSGLDAKRAAGT